MHINIPETVLKDSTLASSAKLIYSLVLKSKDQADGICRLTSQQIADQLGLERTAIPRLVRVLESQGLLKIHEGYSSKNRPQYSYEALIK